MSYTLTLTGDTILTNRFADENEVSLGGLGDILRDSDVTLTQLEALPRGREAESYPAHRTVGGLLTAPDDIGATLADLGVDVATLASNHVLDHSYAGLVAAWRSLDEAGIEHAGTGWDLEDARTPATIDADGDSVAVVSTTATFHDEAVAGQARTGERRPGVSPLRRRIVVSEQEWEAIRDRVVERGQSGIIRNDDELLVRPPGVHYPVRQYRRDKNLDDGNRRTEPLPRDSDALVTAINRAAQSADIVVAHIHCHEFALGGSQTAPPEFLRQFAREAAAAGADVVFAQGSHTLRGVDSHHDTPIIYDLGGLFRTKPGHPQPVPDELLLRPEDNLEGVGPDEEQPYDGGGGIVARCRVADGSVDEVELVVVRRDGGVPRLVTDAVAEETYDRLRELSAAFDATVDDDGTLVIDEM